MKVIVTRRADNRIVKADMEREIERLFQENKDLRLSESHLRDELNLTSQQSEVRRQKMVEKDKEIERMHTKIATVGAERDNFEASYKQVTQWWGNEQTKAREAEERAEEYRIALMESDCRIDELEKQLEWARNKNEEWAQVAATLKEEKKALKDIIDVLEETRKEREEEIHAQHVEKREWMQKYEELKAQKEADDKKSEEICTACNELYEKVLSERNHLREEVARLINERDTVVNESAELIFKINELRDKWEAEHNLHAVANKRLEELQEEHNELEADYDALAKTKREYAAEIDRLRKVVIDLQTNRFTYDEFIGMIMKNFIPSTEK